MTASRGVRIWSSFRCWIDEEASLCFPLYLFILQLIYPSISLLNHIYHVADYDNKLFCQLCYGSKNFRMHLPALFFICFLQTFLLNSWSVSLSQRFQILCLSYSQTTSFKTSSTAFTLDAHLKVSPLNPSFSLLLHFVIHLLFCLSLLPVFDLADHSLFQISSYVGDRNQFFGPEDSISLSLEYYQAHLDLTDVDEKQKTSDVDTSPRDDSAHTQNKQKTETPDLTDINSDSDCTKDREQTCKNSDDDSEKSERDAKSAGKECDKRFLQCPPAVSMKHLQKFIRMKFGLTGDHRVSEKSSFIRS